MVGIVDYGMGNLLSVYNAVEMVGEEARICPHPEEILDVQRLILPGVGAFGDCLTNLRETGFVEALEEAVLSRGTPILGICLGMQAMARRSFEGGEYAGLNWFEADVIRLQPQDPGLRVPQVGWNEIDYRANHPLFAGLPPAPDVYFVHSFFMDCDSEQDVIATCQHGQTVTAAVCKNNICATQFHPEKSQDRGLTILTNFLNWNP